MENILSTVTGHEVNRDISISDRLKNITQHIVSLHVEKPQEGEKIRTLLEDIKQQLKTLTPSKRGRSGCASLEDLNQVKRKCTYRSPNAKLSPIQETSPIDSKLSPMPQVKEEWPENKENDCNDGAGDGDGDNGTQSDSFKMGDPVMKEGKIAIINGERPFYWKLTFSDGKKGRATKTNIKLIPYAGELPQNLHELSNRHSGLG